MTRLSRTRASPDFVERYVPRCRAASHVLFPVVPPARITPRDSEVMIVRGGVMVVVGVGAVYLIWESRWACWIAFGFGVISSAPHVSINLSMIS